MPESKRVLIVEDDKSILESLIIKLEHSNILVVTAETAKEGLAILQKDPHFDLVLLDILMPEGDGFTLLEEKAKDPQINSIPTIILTNLTQKEYVIRAQAFGAYGYLIKADHSIAEVVEIIDKCLKGETCVVHDVVI